MELEVEGLRSFEGDRRGERGSAMLTGVGMLVLELRDCVRSWRGPCIARVGEMSGACVLPMMFWWYVGLMYCCISVSRFGGEA